MKRVLLLIVASMALVVFCGDVVNARGFRGGCRGGACSSGSASSASSVSVRQDRAPAGGIDIMVDGKLKHFEGGQYLPDHYQLIPTAPKAVQAPVVTADYKRQPVRNAAKAFRNRKHKPLIRLLTFGRRG